MHRPNKKKLEGVMYRRISRRVETPSVTPLRRDPNDVVFPVESQEGLKPSGLGQRSSNTMIRCCRISRRVETKREERGEDGGVIDKVESQEGLKHKGLLTQVPTAIL